MPTSVAQVRRRRWRRLAPVSLVAGAGVANVITSLFPELSSDLAAVAKVDPRSGLVLTGRVAAVEVGLLLLVLAWSLARGSRRAWWLAVGLIAVATGLGVIRGQLSITLLLSVVAGVLLLVTRDSFRLRRLSVSRARWWLLGVVISGFVAFALVGFREVDQRTAAPTGSLLESIWQTSWFLTGGGGADRTVAGTYVLALRLGLLIVVVTALWAARPRAINADVDREQAREFAFRYGTTSTAPLLALPDNHLLELDQGRAWAAVGVGGGAAISLGAPVAEPGGDDAALAELTGYCEQNGWTPALFAIDTRQCERAAAAGYARIQIGVEAVIDVGTFSTAGKRRANIRHSVSRARREDVSVLAYEGAARTARRTAQLAEVSAEWLSTKGGPELGFTLGRFDADRLDDQEVYVAIHAADTPHERVVAFVTWLPYANGDSAVLDLMRRARDCPPGVMELLIVDSLSQFADRGRHTASLGRVPLARDPAVAPGRPAQRSERFLGWFYTHAGEVYDAQGLFRFKDKFAPRWEPMWLAYSSRADLPRVALAAARAFLPPHVVLEVLRARRSSAVAAKQPVDSGPLESGPVESGPVESG